MNYIPPPEIVGSGTERFYKYQGVEVKDAGNKGLGVFVEKGCTVPKGTRFPYGGESISFTELKSHFKHASRPSHPNSFTLVQGNMVHDAHPRRLERNIVEGERAPKYAWVGSYVNEPTSGEPNCCFRRARKLPTFQYPFTNSVAFVETVRELKSGEELTLDYNYTTRRRLSYGIKTSLPSTNKAKQQRVPSKDYIQVRRDNAAKMNKIRQDRKEKIKSRRLIKHATK